MGLQLKTITVTLLVVTSFMVSATVSYCGLIGFVGLVIPHLLRMVLGSGSPGTGAGLYSGGRRLYGVL